MISAREAITPSVFDRLDLSKAASAKAVEATFEIIKQTLEAGEEVLITGFGNFCMKDKGKCPGQKSSDRRGSDAGREQGRDLQVFEGVEKEAEW